MKKIKTILAVGLLSGLVLVANTVKENKSTVVHSGDSSKIHGKPGLAVEMNYKVEEVQLDELSHVEVSLVTGLSEGTLTVDVSTLDGELRGIEKNHYEFELSKDIKTFPLEFDLSSSMNGIHYVSLLLSVEGEGKRSFAIPVQVGKKVLKMTQKEVYKTKDGEELSISKAIETIK
jgi:hypothetical protein